MDHGKNIQKIEKIGMDKLGLDKATIKYFGTGLHCFLCPALKIDHLQSKTFKAPTQQNINLNLFDTTTGKFLI